jgi:transposase
LIRIDSLWLAADPIDMRAGADRLLARVVQVFGAAQAHHGYLFANARATRIKLLVHDGFGVWCAARRLNAGRFEWPRGASQETGLQTTPGVLQPTSQPSSQPTSPVTLTRAQFDALVLGLPWQKLEQMRSITRL